MLKQTVVLLALIQLISCFPGAAPQLKEVLLAVGGLGGSPPEEVSTVVIYDPTTKQWSDAAPLPKARMTHSAAVLNNQVYVCGGVEFPLQNQKSCLRYDSLTNKWDSSAVADMNEARFDFGLASLNGLLYAVGGGTQNKKSIEVYDPKTNKWTYGVDLPLELSDHGLAVGNGALWVAGGHSASYFKPTYYNSLFKLDPTKDQVWSKMADMENTRCEFTMVSTSGYLYAIGGWNGSAGGLDTVERYSLTTGKWESDESAQSVGFGKLNSKRSGLGATVTSDGLIYAVGGGTEGGYLKTGESYNTKAKEHVRFDMGLSGTEQWKPITPMKNVRAEYSLVTVQVPA